MPPRPQTCRGLILSLLLLLGIADTGLAGPRVVASISPLHSLVAAVMQGNGSPQLLLRGGVSPHHFSLRPSDARMLADAEVLFWIGPPLELPLARILPRLKVPQAVAMLEIPGLTVLRGRDLDLHDREHHDDREDPGHPGVDPHIWLSPANAAVMTDRIAQVLASADPPNASLYLTNAQTLKDRLAVLDHDLRAQLQGIKGHYAVFHDAYQYLEQRYGLQPTGSVTTHPERGPGAAHLRALRSQLVDSQARCLFSEPQFQAALIEMLGEGLTIRHAILDPLGADIPPGPDAYPVMMRAIATTMTDCMREGDRR